MHATADRPTGALAPRSSRGPQSPAPADGSGAPGRPATPIWSLIALGVLSSVTLAGACWVAEHVHADPILQTAARFLHLVAIIVGLGSVLAVDWFAVTWMMGRHRLSEVLHTACVLQVPIWLGMAGSVVTGLFLRPNLGSPLTLLKLGLVLAVTLNGLYAHWLGQRLGRCRDGRVPRHLIIQSGAAATVSQLGWWGASLIGFVNSHS